MCTTIEGLGIAAAQSICAFRNAWDLYWESLPLMPERRFWDLLQHFRNDVYQYRLGYKRSNGVEQAAAEFCRKALTKQGEWTVPECLLFAKTYTNIVSRLSRKYATLFEFQGDSFGDFMDALPLVGPYPLGVAWSPATAQDLVHLVSAAVSDQAQFRLITRGENYLRMSLRDATRHYWLVEMLERQPDAVRQQSRLDL